MKKQFAGFLLLFCLGTSMLWAQKKDLKPGFRKQRPEEITFLNKLHKGLYESLPHTYKDWKLEPESTFNAIDYWCQGEITAWHDCTGDIPENIGHGDPYALNWGVSFDIPDDQKGSIIAASIRGITDFNNTQQIAKSIKSSNCTKLTITVYANISLGNEASFRLSYCGKTPLSTITLSVPATLALKVIKSTDCPIMSGGRVDMTGNYYDSALIFLGKPVSVKKAVSRDDGLSETDYGVSFDKSKNGMLAVQNIVVQIKGDSADIDEAVKLIDWQKLYGLINK